MSAKEEFNADKTSEGRVRFFTSYNPAIFFLYCIGVQEVFFLNTYVIYVCDENPLL